MGPGLNKARERKRAKRRAVLEFLEPRCLLNAGGFVGPLAVDAIPPGAPTPTTLGATGVTTSGGTLNGIVDPNGSSTDVRFQYSTDPSFTPSVVSDFPPPTPFHLPAGTSDIAEQFLLKQPDGVVVDSAGNVYVADSANAAILKITPIGLISVFAGSVTQTGTADGTGVEARFVQPAGLAIDTEGNLYVTDAQANEVRKITPAGVVSTLVAPGGAGLSHPVGIAVDSAGDVFVANSLKDTIVEVTKTGLAFDYAGLAGHPGSSDGTGSDARFDQPQGVAVDSIGNVFVADTGNATIRKIAPGGAVSTIAGSAGQFGSADGQGTSARFQGPTGIAIDRLGNLYVGDNSVRRVSRDGVVSTLAGTSQVGFTTNAPSAQPVAGSFLKGITIDAAGDLFVTNNVAGQIKEVSVPSVAAQGGLTGSDPLPVNAQVTGLNPGTRYFYRALATNAAGTTVGSIRDFTTATPSVTSTVTLGPNAFVFVIPVGGHFGLSVDQNQFINLTVDVATSDGSLPAANELVTLKEGDVTLGSFPLNSAGHAVCPIKFSTLGEHDIYAVYSGDAHIAASGPSNVLRVQVAASSAFTFNPVTSTTLSVVTPGPYVVGTPVHLQATVTAQPLIFLQLNLVVLLDGRPVTFFDGTTQLGTAQVDGLGHTDFTFTPTTPGLHAISARFLGEGGWDPSDSGATTLFVAPRPAPPQPVDGPSITRVVRHGVGFQPTTLVLSFNQALDLASATRARNYVLVQLRSNGQVDRRVPPISVGTPQYDPVAHTVTLHPVRRLSLRARYVLVVNGTAADGVRGATGLLLDGAGNGQPGSNFATVVSASNLA